MRRSLLATVALAGVAILVPAVLLAEPPCEPNPLTHTHPGWVAPVPTWAVPNPAAPASATNPLMQGAVQGLSAPVATRADAQPAVSPLLNHR